MYRYRVLSEVEWEPRKIIAAHLAVHLANKRLRLNPKPVVAFITQDANGLIAKDFRITGASGPGNTIFILNEQSLDEIVRTCAHECQHRHWYANGMKGSQEDVERRARLFEHEVEHDYYTLRQRGTDAVWDEYQRAVGLDIETDDTEESQREVDTKGSFGEKWRIIKAKQKGRLVSSGLPTNPKDIDRVLRERYQALLKARSEEYPRPGNGRVLYPPYVEFSVQPGR